MSRSLAALLLALLTMCSPHASAAQLTNARPHIILVMPDDMGWGDLAAHGHPLIRTPHLDALHAHSLRMTDFHVSPTCAPTRSALMSGRHEFKCGVTHTILERERMSLDTITLPQMLKTAGYATGIFGKWHLGDEEPYQPGSRGFDEVYIHGGGGIGQTYAGSCGDFPGNDYFNPALRHNDRIVRTEGYCTDLFFQQALRWIDQRRQTGEPFFAYITPNAPHAPLISPGKQYDKLYTGQSIDGKPLNAGDVAFLSMITNIDENVGKLVAALRDWNLEQDTLLIFLSDNGGTHTRLYSGGFRGGKGQVYHGGTHSPLFWRWPGHLPEGVDCPALCAHIDLFPTLAEIAGVDLPDNVRAQFDGRSLTPLLRDPQAAWPDRILVTHQGRWPVGEAESGKFRNCSIRNARFRLVNNQELYDLQTDPGEQTNVIEQHPDIVARLREAYDDWWEAALPRMVNELAVGPPVNPLKAMYWEQLGGGPDEALRQRMDPSGKFERNAGAPSRRRRPD